MNDRVIFGRREKPEPVCQCGHKESGHIIHGSQVLGCTTIESTAWGHDMCTCPGFQRRGPRKATRRSTLKYAKAFERDSAEAYSGRRLGGPGDPDWVTLDNEGRELLAGECEQSKRAKLPQWVWDKLDEAKEHAAGRSGNPSYPLRVKAKDGKGKATRVAVIYDDADHQRLMARLGAFGE